MCNSSAAFKLKTVMSAPERTNMRIKLILCILAVSASSVGAESLVTFYRDGALYQQEAVAVKGVIYTPLAAGLQENSLNITPAPGTIILSVETDHASSVSSVDKETSSLTEQRLRLEDRLQALETREAIFTAAAKSQSGKAPRKTKGNPDPIQAIRQGTDFAIAQLEAVYTARRKTTQEMKKVDARLAAVRKNNTSAENSIRINVTPPRGRVTIRYATAEPGWQPHYNLHLTGAGSSQLQLFARIPGKINGYQLRVSSGSLAESPGAKTFPVQVGSTLLSSYDLPITEERYSEGIYNRFSGMMTNSTPYYLPAGDSGLFRRGNYLGKFRFDGLSSGRSKTITMGK